MIDICLQSLASFGRVIRRGLWYVAYHWLLPLAFFGLLGLWLVYEFG